MNLQYLKKGFPGVKSVQFARRRRYFEIDNYNQDVSFQKRMARLENAFILYII